MCASVCKFLLTHVHARISDSLSSTRSLRTHIQVIPTDTLAALCVNTELKHLNLSRSALAGTLPFQPMLAFENLLSIDFSHNAISGTLPPKISFYPRCP